MEQKALGNLNQYIPAYTASGSNQPSVSYYATQVSGGNK